MLSFRAMLKSNNENAWVKFYTEFSQNNRKFLGELSKKHGNLTSIQFKVCTYIRAGYGNQEIASYLGISKRSADSHSFRLRKKFNLDRPQSLVTYLNTID